MINEALLNKVKQYLEQGLGEEEIKKALEPDGWNSSDVEEAYKIVTGSLAASEPSSYQEETSRSVSYKDEPYQDRGAPLSSPTEEPSFSAGPDPVEPALKPKSSKKMMLVVFAVVAALICAGFLAYSYYFPSPEKVTEKMFEKLTEVRSYEYSGEMEIEMATNFPTEPFLPVFNEEGSDTRANFLASIFSVLGGLFTQNEEVSELPSLDDSETKGVYKISFEGSLDFIDKENPKLASLVNVTIDDPSLLGVFGESAKPSFSLESRVVDKIFYIKIGGNDLGIGFLDSIATGWIRIDSEELKQEIEEFGIAPEETKEIEEQKEEYLEKLKQVKEVFFKYKVFKVAEGLKSEKINKHNCHHYLIRIDKEETKKFFMELIDIFESLESTELTEDELTEMEKSLGEALEKAKLPDIEIWIGKRDSMLYKIAFGDVIEESEYVGGGKYSIFCVFDKFNEPFDVQVPASTKSIEEILEEMFGSMFMGIPPEK